MVPEAVVAEMALTVLARQLLEPPTLAVAVVVLGILLQMLHPVVQAIVVLHIGHRRQLWQRLNTGMAQPGSWPLWASKDPLVLLGLLVLPVLQP
jgi:hypothetical protein